MRTVLTLLALSAVVLGGCKKESPAAEPAEPAVAPATAPASPTAAPEAAPGPAAAEPTAGSEPTAAAEPTATPRPEDPGPTLEVRTGKLPVEEQAPQTLKASARAASGGHLVLRAARPEGVDPAGDRWSRGDVILRVDGERHGVAAIGEGGLFVRLVGEEPPAGPVVVQVWQSPRHWRRQARAYRHTTVSVEGAAAAPEVEDLGRQFYRELARAIGSRGRTWWGNQTPFHAFAEARLLRLAGQGSGDPSARPRAPRRSDLGDMMSLYTGATSVEEALQADRGLLLRSEAGEATVALASLEGVPLPEHPWEDMIRATGKQPVTEPLAARVPQDTLYLHFHDMRSMVKLADDLDRWITPAAQLVEWRSGSSYLSERYQTQLVVERSELSRVFGHMAANGVAFVTGDPFLREGSDVAVLFSVENRTLLATNLGRYESKARERHPDLAEETYEVEGTPVRRLHTPDRAVDQHRFERDGVLYLSNSRRLTERLLAVAAGKAPALSASGDFRYMRTVTPYDKAAEDGFLFISDAFVARAVGPRARILQSRRMAAHADLAAVGYTALLYGWLEGKPPTGVDDLTAAGLLEREELKHADGEAIAFDPVRGASSDRWGRPAALTPLAELDIDKVTEAEKAAYERFRETYQRYWRTYIDPVAVRITRTPSGDRITLNARMLPLIEGSDYDDVIRMVGRQTVRPPRLKHAVQWTGAIGRDAGLRRELDGLGRAAGPLGLGFGWLGDWVMMGSKDTSALWDLLIVADGVPTLPVSDEEHRRREEELLFGVLDRLPIYVGAHVRNPVGLVATLTALRTAIQTSAPDMVRWSDGPVAHGTKTVTVTIDLPERWSGGRSLSLHYAIVGDVFLASMDPGTLGELIAEVRAGDTPTSVDDPAASEDVVQYHMGLVFDGSATDPTSWIAKGLMATGEQEGMRQRKAAFRDMEALTRGLGRLPSRAEAIAYLGYEPSCVAGGQFTFEAGVVSHSLYGVEYEPVVPEVGQPGPITALVKQTRSLLMGLAFEGEGRTRGLHATLEWLRTVPR